MQTELIEYAPCSLHDALMANWFGKLCVSDDLYKVFHSAHTLSTFFEAIGWPSRTVFAVEEPCNVWFVAIFTPHLSGALTDFWVAPDHRKGKAWVEAACAAIEYGLARWPVLVSLTAQQKIVDEYIRLGYVQAGQIPSMWHDDLPVTIGHVTRESFSKRETFVIRRA